MHFAMQMFFCIICSYCTLPGLLIVSGGDQEKEFGLRPVSFKRNVAYTVHLLNCCMPAFGVNKNELSCQFLLSKFFMH